MAWSLGGIKIIVTSDSEKSDTKLSEHVVLDGTESIIHNFGYGDGVRTLGGWLLDNPNDYAILESGFHHGIQMSLVSDQGGQGYYRIWSLNKKRAQDISRTLPVYQIDMELKFTGSYPPD